MSGLLNWLLIAAVSLIVPAAAQPGGPRGPRGTRILIEQALDETAKITLENITLGDAIQAVTEQTGVRLIMPPAVMRLAPQGEKTLINKVDIANLPLREGLNRLLSPLAMTFVVMDDRIEIVPTPLLRSLGRAPTWAELDTLAWLSSIQPGSDPKALEALKTRVQLQVPMPDAWNMLVEAIGNVGAGPGNEVLTVAANALGWGWTLSDRLIVIGPLDQQVRVKLQRPVFVRMENRTLFEVMQAVGDAVGVRVQIEPGALAALPPQVQKNFSLNARNRPAEQALDEIAAYTGLGYLIGPEGVMFYRSDAAPAAATASTPASDPYIAKISISLGDGKTIDWLVRRSELPPDLLEMREDDIREGFDNLRRIRQASSAPAAPEVATERQ